MQDKETTGIAWTSTSPDKEPKSTHVGDKWRLPIVLVVIGVAVALFRGFVALVSVRWLLSPPEYFFDVDLSSSFPDIWRDAMLLIELLTLIACGAQVYALATRNTVRIWWTTISRMALFVAQAIVNIYTDWYITASLFNSIQILVFVAILTVVYLRRRTTQVAVLTNQ